MCSSWGVVMKMKSIPEGFPLPRTFCLDNALEEKSQAMVMFIEMLFYLICTTISPIDSKKISMHSLVH